MCEYWKLKIENLYVKYVEFENWKTKMSKLGCVNTWSWKLKIEIWNLYVKCLEFENLKIEMSKFGW
jgi:preprotein translocase subunit SecB